MKKRENILLWLMVAASLLMSLSALAVTLPKQKNLGFDYLGLLLGFGSLLIAIYVGVQIYQSFNLKKDIDTQNKELLAEMNESNHKQIFTLKEEVTALIHSKIEDYDHTMRANIYLIYAIGYKNTFFYKAALDSVMNGLNEINHATDKSLLEDIVSVIREIKISASTTFKITKEEYDKYASIVWNASNHEYVDIIDYLRSLLPKNEVSLLRDQ